MGSRSAMVEQQDSLPVMGLRPVPEFHSAKAARSDSQPESRPGLQRAMEFRSAKAARPDSQPVWLLPFRLGMEFRWVEPSQLSWDSGLAPAKVFPSRVWARP